MKKIREELQFYLELEIRVDDCTFIAYGIGVEVDKKIKKINLQRVVYKDEIGEIELSDKSRYKFQKLLKENISGNFSSGFAINRPFYNKVLEIPI